MWFQWPVCNFTKFQGENLTDFQRHFYKDEINKDDSIIKSVLAKGFDNFVKNLKSWDPKYKVFIEKLEGKSEVFFKRIGDVYKRTSSFKVLCHGDFHSKNMLYRNDGVSDEDLLFVSV